MPLHKESNTISPVWAGILLRCPSCGKTPLYKRFQLIEKCSECSFSTKNHDAGDGPVYVALCILCFVVTPLVIFIDLKYQPPYWLQTAIWLPTILITAFVSILIFRSLFIAFQYKFNVGNIRNAKKK